jgi:hypothetical protein
VRRHFLTIVLAAGVSLTWMSEVARTFDSTEVLRNGALPKWKALRKKLEKLSGSADETTSVEKTKSLISRHIDFCLRDSWIKLEIKPIPDDGRFTAYARNQNERFEIGRNGRDLPLYVSDFAAHPAQTHMESGSGMPYYMQVLFAGMFVDQLDLCDFLESNKLEVTKLGAVDGEGRITAEVKFAFTGGNKLSYSVVFLPYKDWLVSAWHTKTSLSEVNGSVTYFDDVLDGRYQSALSIETLDQKQLPITTTTYNYEKPVACTADNESFTLAHYGLKPTDVAGAEIMPKIERHWLPWIICTSAVLVVIFLLIWRGRTYYLD